MKIALGTVQWGLDYGIANTQGIPSDEALKSIFALANKVGIDLFDTAVQYGEAEKRVGQFSNSEHRIVTKIGNFSHQNSLKKQLVNSFKHLERQKIYGCLFHEVDDLINNFDLWEELFAYKKEGRINKIGYSVYEPSELLALLEAGMQPDIVQLPFSILDRKFGPYFDLLKNKGVEIHVRSVFLQGLLFKKSTDLPKNIKPLAPIIDEVRNLSIEFNTSILNLCLGYVLHKYQIDYAIVGIDHVDQLAEIISVKKDLPPSLINRIENMQIQKDKLLNPSSW